MKYNNSQQGVKDTFIAPLTSSFPAFVLYLYSNELSSGWKYKQKLKIQNVISTYISFNRSNAFLSSKLLFITYLGTSYFYNISINTVTIPCTDFLYIYIYTYLYIRVYIKLKCLSVIFCLSSVSVANDLKKFLICLSVFLFFRANFRNG